MDKNEQNALDRAFIKFAGKWDVPEMKWLLERGADLNARDEKGYNTLMYAVILNCQNMAEFLIGEGIELETKSPFSHDETALLMAAARQQPDMVRLLLAAGADVNAQNALGHTPVSYAVDDPPTLALLLEAGADINLCDGKGMTPLMHATLQLKSPGESCEMLLAQKPAIEARDNEGNTAMHHAAGSWCQNESLRLLLAAGARINAVNNHGMTPLIIAVSRKKTAGANFLIKAGATLEDRDEYGYTAFAHAVGTYSKETMRRLSDAGACLNAADDMDLTANVSSRETKALIDELKKEQLEKELSGFKRGLSRPMKAGKPLGRGPRP